MKSNIATIVLATSLLTLPFLLAAQELEIEYIDCVVDVQQDDDWELLDVGDSIPIESVIRVASDSIVELAGDDFTITVGTEGTFSVAELLAGSPGQDSSQGLQAFLQNSLEVMFEKGPTDSGTTVMGVRAAEAKEETLDWIDEDEEILEEGKALLEEGDFSEALAFFQDELDYAEGVVADQLLFYSGYAQAMLGRKGPALKILSEITADPEDAYFEEWALLKGQLLFESVAYKESLAVFEIYLEHQPKGKNAQAANFFAGLCRQQLGDNAAAIRHIKLAVELDPGSEIGKTAANWLD